MRFSHSSDIWRDFPELAAGALFLEGIDAAADVAAAVDRYGATARSRLDGSTEGELPEIRAWRRAFSRMGLKPTQYRCASEALLRRFRKEGTLPRLHPLVDLCNALSLATAIPIAVLDVARIAGWVQVRYATGAERYLTFGGEVENPAEGEVVFADADGNAHARRWTNRQSGLSAVRDGSRAVLIVAEAMHDTARADVESLLTALSAEIATAWQPPAATAILGPSEPEFGF
ncbi:phenylalanine--tRNA ligase beta subunit-related protein [Thalassobaculum sp.]|uniref:B3/B4 domain-containing protein n=1 Tax=Thalassobaculum sp. TaxID=2022740 RepID=UPI0032EC35DD